MIGWLAATIVGSISDPRSGSPRLGPRAGRVGAKRRDLLC
jgi:hypothetical protein